MEKGIHVRIGVGRIYSTLDETFTSLDGSVVAADDSRELIYNYEWIECIDNVIHALIYRLHCRYALQRLSTFLKWNNIFDLLSGDGSQSQLSEHWYVRKPNQNVDSFCKIPWAGNQSVENIRNVIADRRWRQYHHLGRGHCIAVWFLAGHQCKSSSWLSPSTNKYLSTSRSCSVNYRSVYPAAKKQQSTDWFYLPPSYAGNYHPGSNRTISSKSGW